MNRLKEEKNILHKINRRKSNWIGDMLHRNCFLKHGIEEKNKMIEAMRRQGRKRKQLLGDLK